MREIAIDAGALSARMSLARPLLVPDGQGGGRQSFEVTGRLWARIEAAGEAREDFAGGLRRRFDYHILVRHRADLAPGMRLIGKSRSFAIEALRDADGSGRFLLCFCRQVPA